MYISGQVLLIMLLVGLVAGWLAKVTEQWSYHRGLLG